VGIFEGRPLRNSLRSNLFMSQLCTAEFREPMDTDMRLLPASSHAFTHDSPPHG